MSDLAQRIDPEAIADLSVSQWDRATRLQALQRGLLGLIRTHILEPMATIEAQIDLDAAEGVWQDRLGERLGLVRSSTLDSTFRRFGFDGSGNVGFGQGSFASVHAHLTPRVPIGDEYYGLFLRMRAHALRSNGSLADLEAMLRSVFPSAYIEDRADGSLRIRNVANDPRQNLATLAEPVIRRAMPAGIIVTIGGCLVPRDPNGHHSGSLGPRLTLAIARRLPIGVASPSPKAGRIDSLTPNGPPPTREMFNWLFFTLFSFAVDVSRSGLLAWHASVAYAHPARRQRLRRAYLRFGAGQHQRRSRDRWPITRTGAA